MVATQTEQEQLRFGLTAACLADIQRVLALNPRLEKAVLFGSRAMGTYKNGSDIDLALLGEQLTYDDVITIYGQLDELLYAYTYDLIDYNKVSNPAVKAHIDDLGIVFYEKEQSLLPTGWKESKLGDMIRLKRGYDLPQQNRVEGSIPIFSSAGLSGYHNEAKVDGPGVITGRYGTLGEVYYCENRFWPHNTTLYVQDFRGNDPKYVYYLLKTLGFSHHNDKSGVPGVNRNDLHEITVNSPPLEAQQEIASILSAFDDKIELNRQMNQTLEAIAQTLFTDLTTSDEKTTLNSYVELNPRLSIKKDRVVKYVEMRDVPESGFSIHNYAYRPFSAGSKFQQNDTLLARITPCLENGKTGFVDFLEGEEIGFGSTEFIVMRAKPEVSPYFIYLLARTNDFRGYAIKSMVGTSGRQRVQSDMLGDFVISRVDEIDMKQFHRTVLPLFQKIRSNSVEIQTLTQLRDSLLPKLMSGKIPVEADA